jgi:hypothetical protein
VEGVAVRDGEYRSTPWKLSLVKCINLVGLKTNRRDTDLLKRSQKASEVTLLSDCVTSVQSRTEKIT